MAGELIGFVVDGQARENIRVQIKDPNQILQINDFVRIESRNGVFFGVIRDIAINPLQRDFPIFDIDDEILRDYVHTRWYRRDAYVQLLYMERWGGQLMPALDIPEQGDAVRLATQYDLDLVMLRQAGQVHIDQIDDAYTLGTLMREGLQVKIHLRDLVRLSFGVFGMSGTGKTFFMIPLIARVIAQGLSGVLIFDFHNDYGYTLKGANNENYPSLKQLSSISSRVHVYGIGVSSQGTIGQKEESTLRIHPSEISPDDFLNAFELSEVQHNAITNIYHERKRYGKDSDWLEFLYHATVGEKSEEEEKALSEIAAKYHIQKNTLRSIQNRVISVMQTIGYSGKNDVPPIKKDTEQIVSYLEKGDAVVLNFSNISSDSTMTRLMVSVLMRRIWQHYTHMRESRREHAKQLLIVLEEAHRFLTQESSTPASIFGRVAREMRKYNVTLAVIDQRPSSIAEDVRSQLSTKFVGRLGSDDDIRAVAVGTPQSDAFVDLIRRLNSNNHMVVGGPVVAAPTMFETIPYRKAIEAFGAPKEEKKPFENIYLSRDEYMKLMRSRREPF
ncbi:MAG: ATP-binding protein [Candidatus Methanomethylicaceae archaeon]